MSVPDSDDRTLRLADGLFGLGPIEAGPVVLLAYDCVEQTSNDVVSARAGLVVVPMNVRRPAPDIANMAAQSAARDVIVQQNLRERVLGSATR